MVATIVYGSIYGTARSYAEELGKRTGCAVRDIRSRPGLGDVDEVVYIGAIYAGSLRDLKKLVPLLPAGVPLTVVAVGLSDPAEPGARDDVTASIRKVLGNRVDPDRIVHARGALDMNRLSRAHRILLKAAAKMQVRQAPPEGKKEARRIAAVMTTTADYRDFSVLDELAARLGARPGA